MKSVDVVIGAMWGDEGKGRLTDDLASRYGSEACVIRFNGGSQAGHTVVTPDGTRHVFHHFGSGTLAGAATYLSKHFIVNPITFRQEYDALVKLGIEPKIYIDERCMVTTIYDMLLNQMTEELRGNDKHGSCGLGINETVVRNESYSLDVFGLIEEATQLKIILNHIRYDYLPLRLKELKIKETPIQFKNMIQNDNMMNRFIDDIKFMIDKCIPIFDELAILDTYEHLIFEGAQGLLLDEESKFFPHVTRSKTGLDNVIDICKAMDIVDIDVHYVSRCYTTKHGAGPFPHELSEKPYKKIVDKTNITNEFQGSLRFSYLNLDLLKEAIEKDLTKQKDCGINIKPDITLTCMDQIEGEKCIFYIKNNLLHGSSNTVAFYGHVQPFIGLPLFTRCSDRRN